MDNSDYRNFVKLYLLMPWHHVFDIGKIPPSLFQLVNTFRTPKTAKNCRRWVKAMEKRLTVRGFEVLIALSGEEALQKLKDDPLVDAVVLDLKMPGMDGLEVLQTIKKLNPLTEAILLTGHGGIDSAVEGMKQGAFDYLTKPRDLEELIIKLEQAQRLKRDHQHDALMAAGRELRRRRGV